VKERFFLDQDSSCHWYLVPVACRDQWETWCELNEDDERSWDPPAFARRLAGSPSWVTFENPVDEVAGG
jgi:hypothetical protein